MPENTERTGGQPREFSSLVNPPFLQIRKFLKKNSTGAQMMLKKAYQMENSHLNKEAFLQQNVRVEPATIEDLPKLVQLVEELMNLQGDFMPNKQAHERGLALILEQPNRGRIFVLRNDDRIFGMVNLLFTISTAMGGLVILLEDFVIHPNHRAQGYGTMLLDYVKEFAKRKNFKRITLLTDKISSESQNFFKKEGFDHSNMIPMRLIVD